MKIVSIIALTALCITGCYYDKADQLYGPGGSCDSTVVVTYSGVVQPLLSTQCASAGCHNSTSAGGGVVLDAYAGARASALSGRLYGTIAHASGYSPMPKGGTKLSACNIALIKKWIDAGAPNN